MATGPSKLFNAIVGLGLAAAGCGGETVTASGEVDASREADAAKDASSRVVDAAVADAGADAREAATPHDAGSLDASRPVDAATAHDAALDAARDVWVEIPVK